MGWGAAFLDADLDGQLDLFIANGHIFADVGDYPQLGETFAQKNQLLLNQRRHVPRRLGRAPAAACRSRGSAAASRSAISTTTATPTSSSATWTTRRRCSRTGSAPGITGSPFALAAPAGNRLAIGARVTVDAGGTSRCARSARAAASVAERPARAVRPRRRTPGPSTSRSACPAGAAGQWRELPVIACTRSSCAERGAESRTRDDDRRSRRLNARAAMARRAGQSLAAPCSAAAARGVAAQSQQGAVFAPKLLTPEALAAVPDARRAGHRRVPAGARRRGDRGAAARAGGRAARRAARGGDVAERLARPGVPRRPLLPADGTGVAGDAAARDRAARQRPTATHARRARVRRGAAPPDRRICARSRSTEFLITAIEPTPPSRPRHRFAPTCATTSSAPGRRRARVEHVGAWRMTLATGRGGLADRRMDGGSHVTSRARGPIFSEITAAALGGNDRSAASSRPASTTGWPRSTRC